jgi:hypothetical protein
MTGQDAANTAKAFNDALPLTGVVLTKTDGDARGGAALSIRQVTGKPIKFLGVGEKLAALEPFHPDRVASRILGMGDVLSLVEEASEEVDQEKAKARDKLKKGKGFDLEDFRDQLSRCRAWAAWCGLMDKLPGVSRCCRERQGVRPMTASSSAWRRSSVDDPDERRVPISSRARASGVSRRGPAPRCRTSTACSSSHPDAEDDEEALRRGHGKLMRSSQGWRYNTGLYFGGPYLRSRL